MALAERSRPTSATLAERGGYRSPAPHALARLGVAENRAKHPRRARDPIPRGAPRARSAPPAARHRPGVGNPAVIRDRRRRAHLVAAKTLQRVRRLPSRSRRESPEATASISGGASRPSALREHLESTIPPATRSPSALVGSKYGRHLRGVRARTRSIDPVRRA